MTVSTPKSVEIPQVQFLVAFLPVSTPKPVEIPQVQFLDKLFMPVVAFGADGQTAQKTHGDSTGAVRGQG